MYKNIYFAGMKPFLNTLAILLLAFCANAQSLDSFTTFKCSGPIPSDFTTAFEEKYKSDFTNNLRNTDLNRRDAREFAVLTNYYNHNLLLSGSVLYGDPISTYANSILDKLLINDPELNDEVRVYTIKSNHVNAYSTNHGIIFVTLGLMAKLESEAQLAYVLAHELGHYKKKHVFQSFTDQKEIWSNSGSYRKLDWEERTLTSFKHSRDAEFEADEVGLDIFLEAGYDRAAIPKTFDILLMGYLPIKQRRYDFSRLESDSFKIPDYFFIDVIDEILADEEVDDSEHTHPNIKKRKTAIGKLIDDRSDKGKEGDYLVKNENDFNHLRTLAQFEMVNTFIRNGNYVSGLYHIQILRDDYPDNLFLKRAELMCWAGMQSYINNRQKRDYSTGYRERQGEDQALYYFASKMSRKGVNTIAARYIWMESEDMEKDEFVMALRKQCLVQLAEGKIKNSFFRRTYPEPVNPGRKQKKPKRYDFARVGFVELFKDSMFTAMYADAYHGKMDDEEEEDYDFDDEEDDVVADQNVSGVYSYYGLSGVNKILYFSPRFYRIDFRKDQDQMFLSSDAQQRDLEDRTDRMASLAGVELVTVNSQRSSNFTTDMFNDYLTLSDWLREESHYEGRDFYSFATLRLGEVRDRYQTDYLGVNYIWHFTAARPFNALAALLAAAYVLPFPFYLYWQIKPEHHMDYMFAVFDLKGGDLEFVDSKSFPAKYRKDIINAHLYNSFNQLSR